MIARERAEGRVSDRDNHFVVQFRRVHLACPKGSEKTRTTAEGLRSRMLKCDGLALTALLFFVEQMHPSVRKSVCRQKYRPFESNIRKAPHQPLYERGCKHVHRQEENSLTGLLRDEGHLQVEVCGYSLSISGGAGSTLPLCESCQIQDWRLTVVRFAPRKDRTTWPRPIRKRQLG